MVLNSICSILDIISNYFQFDIIMINRASFLWYYLVYFEKFHSWIRCILQHDRMKQYIKRYEEIFMKRAAIWLCGFPEFMVNIYSQTFSYSVLKSKTYFSIVVLWRWGYGLSFFLRILSSNIVMEKMPRGTYFQN